MRVHVTELLDGDRLTNDTFNDYGLHVLSKGTVLNNQDISRLFQHRIDYVDIDLRASEASEGRTLESTVNPKWLPTVQPLYENAVKNFEGLFTKASASGMIDDAEVSSMFGPLLNNLQLERDVVSMLLLLNTKDDYTYQHSVQVGMLSYYLATWVGYTNEEAVKVGKAGFLHDIGKCRIEDQVLNKPGRLTEEEYEEVKRHTLYGHEIILQSFDEPFVAYGALQHHERNDGTGYPYGLSGDEIHPVSKIIAVVDIYSAMISQRVYQQKRDLLYVLRELYRLSFKELDPSTTHTFIRHMMPNFIGKRVELVSGESGIIVMTHPTEFFRPLIQIGDDFIDMAVEREYEIQQVYL
ncbi:putative nucleotidyltransferase with HDIG domain [Paenibacillus endophyticus]|uniref:Putative nucleotidyltransferase with HDIG domain n=1 Tax=Paenibacillus endophyticus TaxID=1294268 RepID=A0A7W5CC45_9BACL|nr:HD-GYP domain-containing protein [Paenibacillus endophyticus]MBB3154993.1 putative nucleotidyltransferase with HDIG domain [Paenibacillus endophyticus]